MLRRLFPLLLLTWCIGLSSQANAKRKKATRSAAEQGGESVPVLGEILEKAGWVMTPEWTNQYQPGHIYFRRNQIWEKGEVCFDTPPMESAYASMEVRKSLETGVAMKALLYGASAKVSIDKKVVFDTPNLREIPGRRLHFTDDCLQDLKKEAQRGRNLSSYYVVTSVLSARVQKSQCGSYDAKAKIFVVSADVSATNACAVESEVPVAVAYKVMTVGEVAPELAGLSAAAANSAYPSSMLVSETPTGLAGVDAAARNTTTADPQDMPPPSYAKLKAAAERLKILGPEVPSLPKVESQILADQVKRKVAAVKKADDAIVKVLSQRQTPALYARTLMHLGELYEDFAQTLAESYAPAHFTTRQVEYYRLSMDDKAHPLRKKAKEAYEKAVNTAYSAKLKYAVALQAGAGLARVAPSECGIYERLPVLGGNAAEAAGRSISEPDLKNPDDVLFFVSKAIESCGFERAERVLQTQSERVRTKEAAMVLNAILARLRGDANTEALYKDAVKRHRQSEVLKYNKAEFEKRLAEEEERKELEAAKVARQALLLDQLRAKVSAMRLLQERYKDCSDVSQGDVAELTRMILEQADTVLEFQEGEMVNEVLPFMDQQMETLEKAKARCE